MIKRLVSFVFMSAFVLAFVGIVSVNSAQAQVVTLPSGCSSGLGYSATTGSPCNGRATATLRYMSGCDGTALGYSATNGLPCDGASVAIQVLSGCTSTLGYSPIDGQPCNGTDTATLVIVPPVTPGLPTTGGSNVPSNIAVILASLFFAAIGTAYVSKRRAYGQK